jgi:hypothetical protein
VDGINPPHRVTIQYSLTFSQKSGFVLEAAWLLVAIVFLVSVFLYLGTEATVRTIKNTLGFIGRHPALFLFVPSLYFLFTFTPLWKGGDAVAQLIYPASASNILNFPPLYCFLGRVPIDIGNFLEAVYRHRPLPAFDIFGQQHPSLTGVWLLIILQQVGLVAALKYFLEQTTSDSIARGVLVLVFLPCSSLYSEAHSAGTDALSQILLFLFAGVVISMFRRPTKRSWFAYFALLMLAILTRDINLVLAGWVPLGFLLIMLFNRLSKAEAAEPNWRYLALATLLGVLAIVSANAVQRVAVIPAGVLYRTKLGVRLCDRVSTFLSKLTPEARVRLVRTLVEKENNHWAKRTIELQDEFGSLYNGMGQNLSAEMTKAGIRGPELEKQVDDAALKSGIAYLSSLHPVLIDTIRREFLKGFTRSGNYIITKDSFQSLVVGGMQRDEDADMWRALHDIPNLDLPTGRALTDRVPVNGYFKITRHIRIGVIVALALILSLCCLLSGRRSAAALAVSALASGATIHLLTCVVIFFGARYTIPLHQLALIALCVVLVPLVEEWGRRLFELPAKGPGATEPRPSGSNVSA